MNDNIFTAYDKHYARMGNLSPLLAVTNEAIEAYRRRPWVQLLNRDAPILDVGCGMGHQLLILKRLGFRCLSGIEITEASLANARESLGPDVELVLADAFEFLPEKLDCYGCIVCNDVLEHVPRERVIELLALMHRALKPGGLIVLRVPNMASLLAQYSMYLDFTHVTGFTEYSLMQVLDIAGFDGHTLVLPQRKVNWRRWRPWRPLAGLGLTGIANEWLHRILYRLRAQTPVPRVFDYNVEIYSIKR